MNEDEPLDERYFCWLYSQIGTVTNRNPARSYWMLAKQLYTIPFVWSVPNDDNRAADGIDLREEFLAACDISDPDKDWMELDCSVLELLVGLAKRASFEASGTPFEWFAIMMTNADLRDCTDEAYNLTVEIAVDDTIRSIICRAYDYNGEGGLFPLKNPATDQRDVELWYQLSAYLMEHEELL